MHQHDRHDTSRKHLGIALSITLFFFIVELIGGYVTNSLALLADAWHMLNDATALVFAFVAAWIATRPNDDKKTFGYYRAEILAAFLNGIFLCIVVVYIFYSAYERITHPAAVASSEMLTIAVVGLAANGLSAYALSRSRSESLNVRGAYLHVVSDTLSSVGVIAAGFIMLFTRWYQVDPLFSMIVGALILYGATKLIRESVNILLEGVPTGIDVNLVEKRILEQKGVTGIHDLHIWCITPSRICALSCHIIIDRNGDRKRLTCDLINMLDAEFGIDHTTIQLEDEGYPKAGSEH